MGWVIANYITLGIVIAYGVLLALYIRAETKNADTAGFKRAAALRLVLSALFCAVGLISCWILRFYSLAPDMFFMFKLIMALSLFLAMAGGLLLQYAQSDVKRLRIGLVCFIIMQIMLIVPMCILNGIGWKELVFTAVILIMLWLLRKKQSWQPGAAKKPFMAYTVLLTFMASKAAVNMSQDMTVGAVLLAVGAALFLISYIFWGVHHFHSQKRLDANMNYVTFFAGMMLMALSASPEFSTSLIY